MADFYSKYTGEQIDALLDSVQQGGGGGSAGDGEGAKYITTFTVEDFIEGCMGLNMIANISQDLLDALDGNKIICIPYENYNKGFLIASYKNKEDSDYFDMYLETSGAKYKAYGVKTDISGDTPGVYGGDVEIFSPQTVNMQGGQVVIEMNGNIIYVIEEPVDYLGVLPQYDSIGSSIIFCSASDTVLEVYDYVLWENGNPPILEPDTMYELFTRRVSNGVLAKLSPFKYVE